MTVSDEQLRERLGSTKLSPEYLTQKRQAAEELLAPQYASAWRPVPEEVKDELLLSVVRALHDRAKTTNGNSGTTVEAQVPVRSPRDPLAAIRPILAMYVVPL